MGFDVRIIGKLTPPWKIGLELSPSWWDKEALRNDPRFIESDPRSGYLDYDADLSLDEVRELHERFREEASTGFFGKDGWREHTEATMRELDEALYERGDEFSSFRVSLLDTSI
jgi:hypothetical protein